MLLAFLFCLVLVVHEHAELMHFFMQGLEDRVGGEELVEPGPLPFIEPFRRFAKGGEIAPVVLEVGDQLSRQGHEVVLDDAHDVEPVGHDAGVGEVAPDDAPVGAGKVDADDPDALAALEFTEESSQIRGAFAGLDIENPVVLQVAEGGAEALAFVEGVFVDAEVTRAVQGKAFGGLADGKLVVDAGDGGLSEFPAAGESPGADAVVVALVDVFPERFGTVASGEDAGKLRNEGLATGSAAETVGVDDEPGGLLEAVEVTDRSPVSPLADEFGSQAMGAAKGPP